MQNRFFPQLTPVTRRVLVLFVALDYLLTTLVILLFATDLLEPIAAATGGLINRTLLGNLPLILILVGGVLFGLGRLRARDLGLVGSRLGTALAYTAGLWLLIQLIELALGFALNGTTTRAPG